MSTQASQARDLADSSLDARNLTCWQPLPNGLYTNHSSLKDSGFPSVWTQKQNKSRCILGAFIVPLNTWCRLNFIKNSRFWIKLYTFSLFNVFNGIELKWDLQVYKWHSNTLQWRSSIAHRFRFSSRSDFLTGYPIICDSTGFYKNSAYSHQEAIFIK